MRLKFAKYMQTLLLQLPLRSLERYVHVTLYKSTKIVYGSKNSVEYLILFLIELNHELGIKYVVPWYLSSSRNPRDCAFHFRNVTFREEIELEGRHS